MVGESGGEWIHVYVWLSPFAIHLKTLLIGYTPIQNNKLKGKKGRRNNAYTKKNAMYGKKKKKRERPHSSSPQARTQQEKPSPNHAGTLISDFQSPELWEINICCL